MSTAGRAQADVSLNFWEEPCKPGREPRGLTAVTETLNPGRHGPVWLLKRGKGSTFTAVSRPAQVRGLPCSASLPLAAGSCPRHPTSQAGHLPATSLPLLSALTSAVPPSRSQWLCLPPLVQASRNAGLPVLLQVFRTRRSRSVSRAT